MNGGDASGVGGGGGGASAALGSMSKAITSSSSSSMARQSARSVWSSRRPVRAPAASKTVMVARQASGLWSRLDPRLDPHVPARRRDERRAPEPLLYSLRQGPRVDAGLGAGQANPGQRRGPRRRRIGVSASGDDDDGSRCEERREASWLAHRSERRREATASELVHQAAARPESSVDLGRRAEARLPRPPWPRALATPAEQASSDLPAVGARAVHLVLVRGDREPVPRRDLFLELFDPRLF